MDIITTVLTGYTSAVLAFTAQIQELTGLYPRDQLTLMQAVNHSKTSTGVFENLLL